MKRKKTDQDNFSFRPFSHLKLSISSRSEISKEAPPKPALPPSDEDIFRRAMKDVKEKKEFRDIPVRNRAVKTVCKRTNPDKEVLKTLEGITKGKVPIRLSHTQEYVEWFNPDSGRKPIITKLLHEGKFAVQDMLDLHGYTVDEAEVLVFQFLNSSLIRSLRCVRIIHGRGLKSQRGPALKTALTGWLTGKFRKNIIAFVSARQCDGGLGAVYILLDAKRNPWRASVKKNQ
jgi:DNA-nicking Smr family endonuclease